MAMDMACGTSTATMRTLSATTDASARLNMGLGQKVAPGVTPGRGRNQSRLLCRRSDLVTCMIDGPRSDRKGGTFPAKRGITKVLKSPASPRFIVSQCSGSARSHEPHKCDHVGSGYGLASQRRHSDGRRHGNPGGLRSPTEAHPD